MPPWLSRINTEPLRRAGVATVVLVVVNETKADAPPCRVRFRAAFAVREPMPVTVRDAGGNVVASRIAEQSVTPRSPGAWWDMTLEFALPDGIAARSAQAFAASYEQGGDPRAVFDLPLRSDLPVYETGLHAGDLPMAFRLPP